MKKLFVALLSAIVMVTGAAFMSACDSCGGDKVLTSYTLPEAGTLVESDFVLPFSLNGQEVSWSSDNDAITCEKRTEDWLAKVTLKDDVQKVNLTVKCGKEEKAFSVQVKALDVYYFSEHFNFIQKNSTVTKDFDLETSVVFHEKTATIAWSVDRDEDKNYININEAGNKCLVTQSSLNPSVKIFATFSYNGKTTKVNYPLTVSFVRDHVEEVDYWYNNTGVSITMSGYVVAIGTAYSESYQNVTLYMIDDDFCAGYYLYRVKASLDDGKALEPGVHVTVTNTTNTNYSGLIETNAGGNLVIDKDIQKIDVSTKVTAIDEHLLAGSPEALYLTSTLVSLDKWTVDSKAKTAPAEGASGTLFTLKKGDKKVDVGVSKYLEGVYACKASDTVYKPIFDLYASTNVGDVISVKGILGNYKDTPQIYPLAAADVKKETVAATAPNAGHTNVDKAIKAVKDVMKDNAGYIIVGDKEITVPTTSDGDVAITYEVLRDAPTVKFENGKLIVTTGAEDIAVVKVTYKVSLGDNKEYTTCTYHNIHSKKMSNQDVADKVAFDLTVTKSTPVSVKLPTEVNEYPGATISWAISGTAPADVKITGSTLEIVPSLEADREVKITATASYGTGADAKTATKTFTIAIPKVKPVATGTFAMGLKQAKLNNKNLYFYEINSDGRGATVDAAEDATPVTVAKTEAGGYTLKVGEKFLELNSSKKLVLVDAKTAEWAYDYTLEVFTWTIEDKVYYLGTYNTFDTISASETKYISGDKASEVGVSQFPVTFSKVVEDKRSDDKKAEAALGRIAETLEVKKAGEITLATSTVKGVTFTWSVKSGDAGTLSADGTKFVVTALPTDEDKTVVLTASVGSQTHDLTITVKKGDAPTPPSTDTFTAGTYALAMQHGKLNKKLYLSGAMSGYYFGTTEDALKAAKVEVAAATGGYTLKLASGENSGKYIELELSGSYKNVKFKDTSSGVWAYDAASGVFTWTLDSVKYFLGTANNQTYNTFSACEFTKLAESFAAKFEAPAVDTRTDAEKADAALAKVEATLTVRVAGKTELATSTVDGVTFTWTVKEGTAGVVENGKFKVTELPSADATVVLTVSTSIGNKTKDVTVTVKASVPEGQTIEVNLDFAATFSTYGAEWGSSYSEHSINFNQVGESSIGGTVVLSNANKQSGTITDKPVICAKNTAQYVTVTVNGDVTISSVEFDLQQWSSKTFADMHIEYTTDGTNWTSCSAVITTPGKLASNVAIPAGVKSVRLSYIASESKNTQSGLSAIKLNVAP